MENVIPFLIYSILLIIVGSILALPMRLPFIHQLWWRKPLLAATLSLVLSILAFSIPLLGMTYFTVQVAYVFATSPYGDFAKIVPFEDVPKDAAIKELWLRAVMPPSEPICFTENATACGLADEAQAPSSTWTTYLMMLGIHLIAVVANQWWIERWRKKDGGGETAVTPSPLDTT